MSYSVLNLKQDLTGVIHGTTLNQIVNLNGIIYRAARQLLLDVDPQETKRIMQFTTPVFEQVWTYAMAPDVKGNKIFDIRPIANRTLNQIFNQDYSQQFDLSKLNSLENQFNIDFNSSVKTLNINAQLSVAPIVVNQATSPTTNGTWTVGGGASAITTNDQNFIAGGSSIQFNLLAGQSSGYIETSNMDSIDLTNHLNLATEFLWTQLQTGSSITAVNYRWGSSSTNYYSKTVTVNQANTAFINGWNQLAFDWNGATIVGSPDVTNITYLRITYTYNSTLQTGILVNNIVSQLGQIMQYGYYSKYLFRDAITGAYQETVTDDSNLINLDTESYNILFNQVGYLVAQQLQGLDALFYDATFFQQAYMTGVQRYQAMYKSELQKPRQPYYVIPKAGYTGFLPRRWGG